VLKILKVDGREGVGRTKPEVVLTVADANWLGKNYATGAGLTITVKTSAFVTVGFEFRL